MQRLITMKNACLRRQSGITLIESLVALVVAALGVMGILGVQLRTLTDTGTTVRRAQAIRLIQDLGERMRTNPNAQFVLNSYVSGFSDTPTAPSPSCDTSPCPYDKLAQYDLYLWKQSVANTLPLGQASIFLTSGDAGPGSIRQVGVMVAWRENERTALPADTAYKSDISADGSTAASVAAEGTAAGVTCPTGYTCHLQYLPVASRCIPYSDGSATITQFVCPGN